MTKTHVVKCWPQPFRSIKDGIKLMEIRRNDRDYAVGDIITLVEYYPSGKYTGEEFDVEVMHIVKDTDFPVGIKPGYCVMSVLRRFDLYRGELNT